MTATNDHGEHSPRLVWHAGRVVTSPPRFWPWVVLLGLVGQIAWAVENMYLNVYVYDTITDSPAVLATLSGGERGRGHPRDAARPALDRGLAAVVYTQLTDVEEETNGLLTYDRRVTKIDRPVVRAMTDRLRARFDEAT